MSQYKSFDNTKRKILTTLNQTQINDIDSKDLIRKNAINFQMNSFNRSVVEINVLKEGPETFINNKIVEQPIFNMPEHVLGSIYVVEKQYRPPEITSSNFGFIRFNKFFIKKEDDLYIIQIIVPFFSYTNFTLREVKMYINNPQQIYVIQKHNL